MTAMKAIRCDCGFEVSDEQESDLIERAQAHARKTHGLELPAELVLLLAQSTPAAPL